MNRRPVTLVADRRVVALFFLLPYLGLGRAVKKRLLRFGVTINKDPQNEVGKPVALVREDIVYRAVDAHQARYDQKFIERGVLESHLFDYNRGPVLPLLGRVFVDPGRVLFFGGPPPTFGQPRSIETQARATRSFLGSGSDSGDIDAEPTEAEVVEGVPGRERGSA